MQSYFYKRSIIGRQCSSRTALSGELSFNSIMNFTTRLNHK